MILYQMIQDDTSTTLTMNDHGVSLLAPGTRVLLVVFQQNLLRPAHGCGLPELRKGGHGFSQHQTVEQVSSIQRSASKCMLSSNKTLGSFQRFMYSRYGGWCRLLRQSSLRRRASAPPMLLQQHRCRTLWTRFVNRSWGGPVIDPYPGYKWGAVFMLSSL